MFTRLIPRAEWFTFCETFTREHSGWPTTVWLLGPRLGARVETRDLPFEGIVADRLGTAISIHLAALPARNVEHPVAAPISLWLEVPEDGNVGALGINSADGTTTLLEFRSPVPAELACRRGASDSPPQGQSAPRP